MFLLMISLVSAQPSYLFKQSESADLRASCGTNTSELCGASTACFITVIHPNSSVIINNGTMTNNIQFYNFTLNENQTSTIGTYTDFVYCSGSGINQIGSFTHEITRSGKTLDEAESNLYPVVMFGALVLFLLSLFVAVRMPYKNPLIEDPRNPTRYVLMVTKSKYVKMLFIVITYGLLTWLINLLLSISNNFINLGQFTGFVTFLFNALLMLYLPFIFIVFFIGLYEMVRDGNIKENARKMGEGLTRR